MNDDARSHDSSGENRVPSRLETIGAARQDESADLDALQTMLGIRFTNLDILRQAFVHRSFVNEFLEDELEIEDNERLEFLGDAALELVVSDVVFKRFPVYNEGELTRVRSMVVRRETLAELARDLNLGQYLRLGRGEDESGGRTRPAILCATFEAVMGAVYLDQGIGAVFDAVTPMLDTLFARWTRESGYKDAKSRLQEWSQSRYGVAPRYKVVEQWGPDHAKIFVILVSLLQQRIGVGSGMSKQEASQRAANMALTRVDEGMHEETEEERMLAAAWAIPEEGLAQLDEIYAKMQAK